MSKKVYLPSFLYQNKMIFEIRFNRFRGFVILLRKYIYWKGVMYLIIKGGNYVGNKIIILAN